MNRETKQVREFMVAAKQELPNSPTMPSLQVRILRAKLMLEECIETVRDGLGVDFFHPGGLTTMGLLEHVSLILKSNSNNGEWKSFHDGSLEKIADGCADTMVVTIGTELACGIDGEEIFEEVHRSNMSKFIDGSFREDGKYVKGPAYSKPDIARILKAQSDFPIGPIDPPEPSERALDGKAEREEGGK